MEVGVVLGGFYWRSPSWSESLLRPRCSREGPGGQSRQAGGGLNLILVHGCIPNTRSLSPHCDAYTPTVPLTKQIAVHPT